MEAYFENVT